MREISIVIATRNRWEKLKKTIESIYINSPQLYKLIKLLIIFDGDQDGYSNFKDEYPLYDFQGVHIELTQTQIGSVAARNLITPYCNDGLIWATDDITFNDYSLWSAFKTFNEKFPDDDGVVGFVQEGVSNFHPTGVGLMGQKFLQRYPGKKLFYPGYFHFACQEIYWLANKYGKFYQDPEAKLFHFHPAFHKELTDQTHIDARVHKKRDHDLIKEREAAGLIWGDA